MITAENGVEAVAKAKKHKPHLIIMDVMMPQMDGIEACEKIRDLEGLEDVVIAFFTARGEDYSQVAGYDAGADDYITKPVKPKVMVSKVKGLLRRLKKKDIKSENELVFEGIKINRDQYYVEIDGKQITLPRKEFELLSLLASSPNKVFNREVIWLPSSLGIIRSLTIRSGMCSIAFSTPSLPSSASMML